MARSVQSKHTPSRICARRQPLRHESSATNAPSFRTLMPLYSYPKLVPCCAYRIACARKQARDARVTCHAANMTASHSM